MSFSLPYCTFYDCENPTDNNQKCKKYKIVHTTTVHSAFFRTKRSRDLFLGGLIKLAMLCYLERKHC